MPEPRQRVKWNESNLTQNKEFFTTHPILYEISEPKTPFHQSTDIDPEELHPLNEIPAGSNSTEILTDDDFTDSSSIIQCEDSMESTDGETWRVEENKLAHDAKVELVHDALENVHKKSHKNRMDEKPENIDSETGKEIFEKMRQRVLEDERRKFKESRASESE